MCRRRKRSKKCCFSSFFMGQAASMPYNHCQVNYPRQPVGNTVRSIQEHRPPMPTVSTQQSLITQPNAIVVPLHYYPNSFYTPSAGGSIINRIEDSMTEINERITESLDMNRFYNQVRDPSIPLPPGHIVHTNTYMPLPMHTPQGMYPSQNNIPPSYGNPSFPPSSPHAYYGNPPPYTPTAPQLEEPLYPSLEDTEKKMKNLEVGSKT